MCFQNNGKHILWEHLHYLYEHTQAESGLYIGRRLTYEHIHLTPYSKMKVNLAAQVCVYRIYVYIVFHFQNILQVLSNSVSCAFEMLKKEEFLETAKFCHMFDRFFDCLNTRRVGEGKEKRKPDLDPYTSDEDTRLTVSWVNLSFKSHEICC